MFLRLTVFPELYTSVVVVVTTNYYSKLHWFSLHPVWKIN